jgi:hypothetical protein
MRAPDYVHEPASPEFVPKEELIGSGVGNRKAGERFSENPHSSYQPNLDDPFFKRHSGNWAVYLLQSLTETVVESSSARSCMVFEARVIRGHSTIIRSRFSDGETHLGKHAGSSIGEFYEDSAVDQGPARLQMRWQLNVTPGWSL